MQYKRFVFLLLIALASCGKQNDLLPDIRVNFEKPISDPSISSLFTGSGKAVIINNQGIKGIILYSVQGGIVAFDRCSTVNPEKRCAVILDDGAFTVTDPCSGAKFLLFDGSPAKAPATIGLKRYTVTRSGDTLIVTN